MAGTLKHQDYQQTVTNGFIEHSYTEVWQVNTSSLFTALDDSSVPPIYQAYLLSSGVTVWCLSRKPQRRDDEAGRSMVDVTCEFTNDTRKFERDQNGNPATDPEQIVPQVQRDFVEVADEQINDAEFVDIRDENDTACTAPSYMSKTKCPSNSAGCRIPNVAARRHNRIFTYWTYHRDWSSSWDEFVDKINSNSVTMTEVDPDGVRSAITIAAGNLRCNNIIKQHQWRGGKLYFRRGIVLEEDLRGWIRKYPDEGTKRHVFENQYKSNKDGTYTTWAAADVNALKCRQMEIVSETEDGDKMAHGETVPFNGYGQEIPYPNPTNTSSTADKRFFVRYRVDPEIDFTPLGIQ